VPKATPRPCTEVNCGELFPRCGKYSTYTRYGCRCDDCRTANRQQCGKYRAENLEECLERDRRYVEANRDKIATRQRQYHREHYAENCDKYKEQAKRWQQENRDAVNASRRRRQEADPEAHRAARRKSSRKYSQANRGKLLEKSQQWRAKNPDRVRKYGQKHSSNRRAVLLAAWVEDVDPKVVFQRDGYICQWCGIECSPTAKRPDRDLPSLDHIIPLSWGVFRGGFHSYANTQLLCHSCNCKKKDREQNDN